MENKRRNLNISGSGCYPGGEFEKVSISGSGKIEGDIKCVRFSTSGSSKIEGNIVCDSLGINGSSKIKGNITGRRMGINGSCRIDGSVSGEEMKICGSASVGGSAKVGKLEIYGSAKIEEDIEAEDLYIMGGMKHTHFINAERVTIETKNSGGSMEFNEMGATTVSINQQSEQSLFHRIMSIFSSKSGKVIGRCIEADVIKIDHAVVDVLRGGDIEIGPGCDIKLVEYTGNLRVHDTARVHETKQIEK